MRGIRRSEQFDELVHRLGDTQHQLLDRTIFPTMREVMCFAAVLGYENERSSDLQAKTLEIDGRNFANSQQALDLLYLVGLASSKDVETLREEREDEMIQIFEKYAQGGLEIIQGWLREKPEDQHGDQAILAALAKYGYLDSGKDVDAVIGEISF
jgi:dnd system-associated protein 4